MELTLNLILKIVTAVGFIYIVLSLFNVHWLLRVRILASMAVGTALIGFLMWPPLAPADPLGAVTLFSMPISVSNVIFCFLAAFFAGAGGYLVSYPYGKVIGLLAVPTGLGLWALRSGTMRNLLLTHSNFQQRIQVYDFLHLEPLFWITVLLVGAVGVWITGKVVPPKVDPLAQDKKKINPNRIISIGVAILASGVIALLTIGLFAQDVRYPDAQLGSVTGQPASRQIAFAVFASFTLAAFLIKYFVDGDHYLAVVAGPILYFFVLYKTCGPDILQYMTENWAVTYFPNTICAILPIQIVSFSAIGALSGHWLAVKYKSTKEAM